MEKIHSTYSKIHMSKNWSADERNELQGILHAKLHQLDDEYREICEYAHCKGPAFDENRSNRFALQQLIRLLKEMSAHYLEQHRNIYKDYIC